jgi:hypothetical protein
MVGDFVARQLAASGAPAGTVLLNPRWTMDYLGAVTRYLNNERLAATAK